MSSGPGVPGASSRQLGELCRDVVENVEGAVACGVVELVGRELVAGHAPDAEEAGLTREAADAIAALLRGPWIETIGEAALDGGEVADEGEERGLEVHVATPHASHFARTVPGSGTALVLRAGKGVNVGMAWARVRAACREVRLEASG